MAKSRRSPVSTDKRFKKNQSFSDYGPIERWQHFGRTFEKIDQSTDLAARVVEEHVLDILVLKSHITPLARDAGFRFKADFQFARLDARTTARYAPSINSRDPFYGYERSDAEEAAYRRWRHAINHLGVKLANAVISTACHDLQPTPATLPALQTGLEKLIKWYGL